MESEKLFQSISSLSDMQTLGLSAIFGDSSECLQIMASSLLHYTIAFWFAAEKESLANRGLRLRHTLVAMADESLELMLDLFLDSMHGFEARPLLKDSQNDDTVELLEHWVPDEKCEATPLTFSATKRGSTDSSGSSSKRKKVDSDSDGLPEWVAWVKEALLPHSPGAQKKPITVHSLCSGMCTESEALKACCSPCHVMSFKSSPGPFFG